MTRADLLAAIEDARTPRMLAVEDLGAACDAVHLLAGLARAPFEPDALAARVLAEGLAACSRLACDALALRDVLARLGGAR